MTDVPSRCHGRRANRAPSVRQAVTQLQLRHPELRQPPTVASLRAVLDREGIRIREDLEGPLLGRAVSILGDRVILLHPVLHGPAWLVVALHELGHITLHLDDPALAAALRREAGACGPIHDQVEQEAEAFARSLLGANYATAAAARDAIRGDAPCSGPGRSPDSRRTARSAATGLPVRSPPCQGAELVRTSRNERDLSGFWREGD